MWGGVLVEEVLLPSDNNKLKKLGKYFTKGLQAGVLATALIAGNVSCSNAAGGSEITNNNGGGINGGNGNGNGNGDKTFCEENHPAYTHPTYMNVAADFGGQRFVESNADWFEDNQYDKNTKFDSHYDDADKYINCKVAELNRLWQENNTESALSNQIGTALSKFNKGTSIADNIDKNYTALAPVFKTMRDKLGDKDYHRFNVSYQKLAADAYNQSIGAYAGNEESKKDFTSNTEISATDIFFKSELDYADLSYQEATDAKQAATRMNSYLSTIAHDTSTNVTVLKKVVELALYNESLYGLNDYANRVNVVGNLKYAQRSLTIFNDKIKVASVANTQNIDDRTM